MLISFEIFLVYSYTFIYMFIFTKIITLGLYFLECDAVWFGKYIITFLSKFQAPSPGQKTVNLENT